MDALAKPKHVIINRYVKLSKAPKFELDIKHHMKSNANKPCALISQVLMKHFSLL